MTKALLLVILIPTLHSYGQNNIPSRNISMSNQDTITYIQKGIEFIKQVERQSLMNSKFILSNKPVSPVFNHCIGNLLVDTATFTKDELIFLKAQQFISIPLWKQKHFPNINLINLDSLKAMSTGNLNWWDFFYENVGREYSIFSFPLFLRNYTYCIFYSDNNCGLLCGQGMLSLYKKENDKWVVVKFYCFWIS
ncbi:MAG: hypothetical protein R2796_07525 [Chitinophagaceae bacterium]